MPTAKPKVPKKPATPALPVVPPTLPSPPTKEDIDTGLKHRADELERQRTAKFLPVIYPGLEITEYSTASKSGPLTVELAKTLMGWETEKEYQTRMVAEKGGKPEHYLFAKSVEVEGVGNIAVHCEVPSGDKKRANEKVRAYNNANNRPLDEGWVEELVHTILHGQWAGPATVPGETVNGETVRVGRTGRILSAQHQLTALILADDFLGKSRAVQHKDSEERFPFWVGKEHCFIETIVITGVSEDDRVLRTIDYVKPRTVADMLYTMPLFKGATPVQRKEMCKMASAAIDLLWTRTDAQGYRTHPEVVMFLERHKRILKAVKHLFVENTSRGDRPDGDGGRRISKLYLSAGQAAGLCYLMGCTGPKTDSDAYRNESPPTEKGLDWSYWDRAREFWAGLANRREFIPVRTALIRLPQSDPNKEDNLGMGGNIDEKLAILAKAWYIFRDDASGEPFCDDDLIDGGALSLSYTDTDPKGVKWPDGKITLIDVADFAEGGYGIDCPEFVDKKAAKSRSEPVPLAPTREEIEKASQEALKRREGK